MFGFVSTDPEFRALMDVLDANGDGEIEMDEFEEALENPALAAEQADEELAPYPPSPPWLRTQGQQYEHQLKA